MRSCRYLRAERLVPSLEVEGAGAFDVPEDMRLMSAIEEDTGVDILHDAGPQLQKV